MSVSTAVHRGILTETKRETLYSYAFNFNVWYIMKDYLLMNTDSWDHSYKKFKTSAQFHIAYYKRGLQVTILEQWRIRSCKSRQRNICKVLFCENNLISTVLKGFVGERGKKMIVLNWKYLSIIFWLTYVCINIVFSLIRNMHL